MKKVVLCWGVVALLGSVSGCGDPPRAIWRDAIITQNELADLMVNVVDEETAKPVVKNKLERIKKKWEGITERARVFAQFDAKEKEAMVDVVIDTLDECLDTLLRLRKERQRLEALRFRLFQNEYEKRASAGNTGLFIDLDTYKMVQGQLLKAGYGFIEEAQGREEKAFDKAYQKMTDKKAPFFIEAGLANLPHVKRKVTQPDVTLNGAELCPALSDLIQAPEKYLITSVWNANPLFSKPPEPTSTSAPGPAPAPAPKVGPAKT